ncbi:hypothetical protein ACFLT1_01175 [Bacteroidota bacterium]
MKTAITNLLTGSLVSIFLLTFSCTSDSGLDSYGGLKSIKGAETGFFHLEEIDGRNWFITPEGNAFFALAISHLYSGDSDVACKNAFGDDHDKYYEESFERTRAMGFNCALGGATSPERNLNGFVDVEKAEQKFRDNHFPYTVGLILIKHQWEFEEGETLPDIFAPEYEAFIDERAAELCPKYKDDPLVMGYYYGFGAFNETAKWVNHHLSHAPNAPGRTALVNLLEKRYNDDVDQFNDVYGLSLSAISDLKEKEILAYDNDFENRNFEKTAKTLDTNQLEDFEAIVAEMCTKLYKMGYSAIKKYDKNHLIFGSFVKEWALSAETWKATAPYIDMIAPQHFNFDISHQKAAEAAGLPVLFSDDYFGFCYPKNNGKGGYVGVDSHDARGIIYNASVKRHFKDPSVAGVTYCICMYDQGGEFFENWGIIEGFYDIEGSPREKLIQDVTEANKHIYEHATTHAISTKELMVYEDELFRLWEKHGRGYMLWGN